MRKQNQEKADSGSYIPFLVTMLDHKRVDLFSIITCALELTVQLSISLTESLIVVFCGECTHVVRNDPYPGKRMMNVQCNCSHQVGAQRALHSRRRMLNKLLRAKAWRHIEQVSLRSKLIRASMSLHALVSMLCRTSEELGVTDSVTPQDCVG